MIDISIQKKLTGAEGVLNLKIDTRVQKGELVTLYGPTGSGKSSVIRMLAGLLRPDQGRIKIGDEIWFDSDVNICISPQQRAIGMVFQEYALFPNMTVRENLEYALTTKTHGYIVDELLDIAELTNLQDKRPTLLSGGQRQRVALARALVRKPTVLLLDEPLSALDLQMRSKLQDYISEFHKRFNLTTILISHDPTEVIKLSNRVLVLENGSIQKDCPPAELMTR